MSRTVAATVPAAPPSTAGAVVPKATLLETMGVVFEVLVTLMAKGPIIRRPKVVALAERLNLDQRAVRRLQRLRDKYGPGPLLLAIPLRRPQALVLAPEHARRVLDNSPEPFASASSEKQAVVSHFAPENVLISRGPERADRRHFNEAVLDADCPRHRLAARFQAIVAEEAAHLLAESRLRGELPWDEFIVAWYRAARRVVLGDAASDDHELTDLLARLRSAANWAFLRPKRRRLRDRFYDRLAGHLARAEPGSLAAIMAATPITNTTAPSHQVAQWLFASDAAGMATFRALALLAAHPAHAARARTEITASTGSAQQDLPYLRACILESVRLWPTTPLIHRQSTRPTTWESGVLPAETGIVIFVPFFHRDERQLPDAHRFAPELWLQDQSPENPAPIPPGGEPQPYPHSNEPGTAETPLLIPFSGGPGRCPGQNLVLLMGSAMLAVLLDGRQVHLKPPGRLDPRRPLPATLNHYSLSVQLKA